MITFQQVSYSYPDTEQPALHDITLELPPGCFALLAGQSGAGKSTLLRCINGLTPHFSGGRIAGRVEVFGHDPIVEGPQAMSRLVGFVAQDPEAQFVMDRVEDEIAFALENAAFSRQEMRLRVEEVLDLLDLEPLRMRALATLSGGERQRVAIAAALALRPRVLVLDEPTSQLDPKSAEDVLQALVRLNSDLGLTIVLAEHRLERVLPFVDTLVALGEHGAGLIAGPPREVLEQIELVPPLVAVGKALGWKPLPLTVKEGLRFSRNEAGSINKRRAATGGARYVEVRGLAVNYGGRAALRGVDLELRRGEIVALMGRNGAGKSTLLRAIIGLLRPQRGVINVDGRRTSGREVAQICREIGYLPQDPNALLFADSVRDELQTTLRNHGMEREAGTRVTELLERLGLGALAERYPRDLSAGERLRVAFGAIAVTRPGALLLDEPTRGLDYGAKRGLVQLLREWRDEGAAVLVVTHDVEFAAEVADRVVVMSQGEVIAAGAPAEVMGGSQHFAPQVARLFPGSGWLTAGDAVGGRA